VHKKLGGDTVPLSHSFSRMNKPASSAFPHRESDPAPDHLQGHSLNPLQLANTFPVLGFPKLDTVFWMLSGKFHVEGRKFLPSISWPCSWSYSPGHYCPPLLPGHMVASCPVPCPPRAFPRNCSQTGKPQPVLLPGRVPCRGRNCHLSLWEFLIFLSICVLLLLDPFH